MRIGSRELLGVHLSLLSALGLLGCGGRTLGGDDDAGSGSSDSGESGTATSADTGESGTSADTGTTADTTADTTTSVEPHVCDDPQIILQAGTDTPSGFVLCADGFVHRVEPVECLVPQAADSCDFCFEDCSLLPFGSCQAGILDCLCNAGCATDSDCSPGQICACAGVVGAAATCIPADCTSDSDCGEGLCGLSQYQGCCGDSYQLACAAPDAPCHVDTDCPMDLCDPNWPEGGTVQHQCSVIDGVWTCNPPGWCGCDCGRPLLVAGEARTAPAVARADWSASPILAARAALPRDQARRLAAHWTAIARYEHASVASFARFAQQLLQLGAPPALLRDTAAAMADEVAHARLAFGLAGAYADAPIGPGALALADVTATACDRRTIVEALIIEACVGETLAALEAREAALQAVEPPIAAVLERIAADELRHAQLGWRALGWLLAHAPAHEAAELRGFARATLRRAIAAVGEDRLDDDQPAGLRAHGLLDAALRGEVRRRGLAEVVAPTAAALG